DVQHQVWLLTLEGRLHTIQTNDDFKSILDIGCGTGVWAHAMALAHPNAHVTATDITLPKETSHQSNLTYIQADADEVWPLGKFSFIHGRMLTSGIHNWPQFLSRCYEHLEPNGALELLDICHPWRADDGITNETSSAFIRFGLAAEKSWARNGLDYRTSMKHVERMKNLGFVDVKEEEIKWPLGNWSDTKREKEMGNLTLGIFKKFLEMAGVHILTASSGMSGEEASELVTEAQKDLAENCVTKKYYLAV
ncbi:S-adenosyl-L-methionine-dependent methyltransferase, partial [Tricladium varicosporioides]